jgi:hypothetical protein
MATKNEKSKPASAPTDASPAAGATITIETDDDDDEMDEEALERATRPDAQIVVTAQPRTTKIMPRMDANLRIARQHYSFKRGVAVTVPSEICDHLKRINVI